MSLNGARLGNRRDSKGRNKYKQGKYYLQNINKYIGHTPVLYRSSWELAFCKYCDLNSKVVKWSTESVIIPYKISNNGQIEDHRYIPDFYIEMTTNVENEYERIVVEIKPKAETEYPKPPQKQTLKMLENYEYSLRSYKQNIHKWAFAKDWCEKRHMKFIIMNEDYLKKMGLIN
jgi:hypothetical protein